MHTLEVGEHDVSVEAMTMLDAGVLHDLVSDHIRVLTRNVTATARARLRVSHCAHGTNRPEARKDWVVRGLSISNRTVLVTGATGGLGAEMARALAARGARLIVTGRRSDELATLATTLAAEGVVTDLADRPSLDELAKRAIEADVLIASAALPATGDLATFTSADLDRAVEVNLRAPMQLARVAAPAMTRRGRGHIVLIGSLGAKLPGPALAVYTATKAGLRGFGLGLREELRSGNVGVSVINPGPIRGAGMWADAGLDPPRGAGTRTASDVAAAVIRAIERDIAEIDVATRSLKVMTVLAALSPRAYATLARRAGAEHHARALAERLGHRR